MDVPYIWPAVPELMDIEAQAMAEKRDHQLRVAATLDAIHKAAAEYREVPAYDEHIMVGNTRIFYES